MEYEAFMKQTLSVNSITTQALLLGKMSKTFTIVFAYSAHSTEPKIATFIFQNTTYLGML